MRYLAGRASRQDLYPQDPVERARIDEFLERFQTGLRAAINRHEGAALGYSAIDGIGQGASDPSVAATVELEIAPTLRLLDQIVGPAHTVPALERFTIADCALAPVLYRTLHSGFDLSPYAHLMALRSAL